MQVLLALLAFAESFLPWPLVRLAKSSFLPLNWRSAVSPYGRVTFYRDKK